MPSTLHETLVEMFRQRPTLAADLLGDALGLPIPAYEQARLDPSDLTDLSPTEYRSDAVVVLSARDRPVLAVVVEVQLRRDPRKRWSWPVYLTTLRARLRCPAVLLVLCVDEATAAWCGQLIELGNPGSGVLPLVLGPDRVPVVIDAAEADHSPELVVLSALAHGGDPERRGVLDALVGVFGRFDQEHALLYSDLVLAALPAAAQRYLEALMISPTHEWQSDFARRYVSQGRTEGRTDGLAEAVLVVLDARGVAVPDVARVRILGCSDAGMLDVWVRRAATVGSVDELFDDSVQ